MIMNKRKPKITIISPCYMHKEFLEESLLSISNQTFKDFKAIIFDDASKDDSFQLLQNLAKLDKRFLIGKNQYNLGAIKNINKHLQKSNSDYVALFSSDDLMLNNHIEKLLNNLLDEKKSSNYPLAAGSLLFTNRGIAKKYKIINSFIIFFSRFHNLYIDIDLLFLWNIFFSPISLIVPKVTIDEFLKIENNFTTSTDYLMLAISMSKNNLLLKIIPEFTTFYRKHQGNISKSENFYKDRMKILNLLKANDYIDKHQFLFYQSICKYKEIPSFKNTLKLIFLSLNYFYFRKQFFRPFLITGLTLTIAQGIFKIFRVKRN